MPELAFKIAPHHVDWPTLLEGWRIADGIDTYVQGWNFDHFYPIQGDTSGPCLEGWVTLTAAAQATHRLRVGCLVNGVVYRHPAVLANMASTLDIVSGGRLELGLGAGWNEQECDAYGIELGTLTERFDRFDEACDIVRSLLAEETTSYEGRYFTLTEARNEPKGPQQPLAICIGGDGERRTLRTVARVADHWNIPYFTPERYAHRSEVLAEHCAAIGRDPATIKRSTHVFAREGEGPGAVADQAEQVFAAGIDQAIVYLQPPIDLSVLEPIAAACADLVAG